MNKIYKVIWSKTRNCYVAVAEFVKRNGKGSSLNRRHIGAALGNKTAASLLTGKTVAAALLAASVVCGVPGMALANSGGTLQANGDYIGVAPEYNVTIDENVNGSAYGRYETDNPASGAMLSISTGGKATAAFGGRAASGDVTGNKVTMSGGEIVEGSSSGPHAGNLYGGLAVYGDAKANEVTVSGGTLGRFTYVYGGLSEQGAAGGTAAKDGNKVTITGGTVGTVQGGYSRGDASHNSVEIDGGTVQGTAYGGQSTQGNALNNSVTVKEGTVQSDVYGGYTSLTGMKAAGNKVTITGGVVQNVYGGWVEDMNENGDSVGGSSNPASATENTVEIRGGTVWDVYGGRSALGPAERNTVILAKEEGKDAPSINGTVYGGYSERGGSVKNNTLQVEAVGLSARAIYNFDNYKFVLPADSKAGDTMLKLTEQGADLTIDGTKVDMAVAKDGGLNIGFGESVTLLHKTGGTGAFNVENVTGAVQTSKLDGVSTGFDVMKYKLDKPANEDKLNVTVSELHLYGDGGTNTPGQRQTGNTLIINSGKADVAFGGRAATGDVTGNNVKMTGGEIVRGNAILIDGGGVSIIDVSGMLFGGFADDGKVEKNTVELSGGTVGSWLTGGLSLTTGDAANNTVTIRGGTINGYVFGGYSEKGKTENNTVILSKEGDALPVINGTLFGGFSAGGGAVSGNTLQVEAAGLSAPGIRDFDKYRFVLPKDTKANDTMLKLTGQNTNLEIDGANVSVSSNVGKTGLNLNESITLLHRFDGRGDFYVYNLPSEEQTAKLDGVEDGLTVMKYKLDSSVTRLNLKVSELYLYGDGGKDNTPGQRESGNTLTFGDGTKANAAFGGMSATGFVPATVTGNTVTMEGGELVKSGSIGLAIDGGLIGGYNDNYNGVVKNNTAEVKGGTINGNVHGGRVENGVGVASENHVIIRGGTVTQDVSGGYVPKGMTERNTVTVYGGTIKGQVFGGNGLVVTSAKGNIVTIIGGTIGEKYAFQEAVAVTGGSGKNSEGNTVNISGGTVKGRVRGGSGESATSNTVAISGGKVNGNVYGGQSVLGAASGNKVTISGGTLDGFNYVYGGLSEQGAAGGTDPKDGNKVTITGGMVGTVQGGYSRLDASYNSVEIAGGKVQGNAYGGQSTQGNALNNSVTVKEGTAGWVFGGHTQLTGMKAAGNKVTITGGTVSTVVGGWVEDKDENGDSVGGSSNPATATENTVEIRGGTVNGYVYGGQSVLGPAYNNTVILAKEAGKNAPNLDNAILCGGFGGSVSDNTLQVEAAGLSARAIYNFDNYKFVLPSDIKAGDTMLKLKGQGEDLTINADYVNLAVFNNAAPGMALLGERITLVEKAGGNGTFGVDGLKTGGEGIYPLWLDGQEGIEVADYSLTADSTRLDMKLEGLYLYGEGGTNPTLGQRKSNNTLTVSAGTKATAAFGGRVNIGDVTGNKVTMSGGELVTTDVTHPNYGLSGNVYGGLAEDSAATGNRVTLEGGTLRAAYGGFSFAGTAGGEGEGLGNSVAVRGGQVAEGVYGGYALEKDAVANLVAVSGGTVSGDVVGGYTEQGHTIKNVATVEDKGNIKGNVIAGQSEKGEVRANTTITAKGSLVAGSLFGGRSESGEVHDNTVTMEGGQAASAFGGRAASGNVTGNNVTMSFGTLTLGHSMDPYAGNLYGGLSEGADANQNTVTINDGSIERSVHGGNASKGASGNAVTVKGGTIGGTVTGGTGFNGATTGNTVTIHGGVVNGVIHGGVGQGGAVSGNRVTIEGGRIAGEVIEGGSSQSAAVMGNNVTVQGSASVESRTIVGGMSNTGAAEKNTVTLGGGEFKTGLEAIGGQSNTGSTDNAVNLTGTTTGLEGATLRGYSDATAAHSGNELHVGGVKEYDASGNATITKATWQGTASASNGTGTLLRTAALRNTAGASGGTAQQGAAGSGTNGNRVDTVANFDSIALHNVVWGDVPALSAKNMENIGGLDVTGLEFFARPDNSTVREHALSDSMVLIHSDGKALTGLNISYLDENTVKTEALTNEGINYHTAAHHTEDGGVTVDGIEKKRIYLADHNKSVDFSFHVDGDKIILGDVAFVKGGTARTLDGRFDVRNADIDAAGLKMTADSIQNAVTGDTMTVVDAEDAIKAKGATATLKTFTGEGVTGGVKKYDVAFSDDVTANLNLSGIHTDTLSQNAEKTKLIYTVGEKKVSEAAFAGELAWKDGVTHYTNKDYNFNADAKADLSGLTFGKVTADPIGQSMTLIGGKAAGTVENAPASFGVTLAKANTTLDATAAGVATVANGDVTYSVTGVTLDKVTVNQVTASADSVPDTWTVAKDASGKTALTIDTDSMTLSSGSANKEHAILTTSGSFAGAKVTGKYAYASHSPFTKANGGVSIAGEKEGGVKLSDDSKSVVYHVVQDHVKDITLGSVTFAKDTTLLPVGNEYEFTKVNAVNAQNFAMNYAVPQNVAANDSMTLLQANNTLQANALLANMAADVKSQTQPYSFAPVDGVTVAAKITGSLGTTAKGDGFTYTMNSNQADKLTFGSVDWKDGGVLLTRPANITFEGAEVDTSKIHFKNVHGLDANKQMTLVSDFGNNAGKITGSKYYIGATLEGEGSATLNGSDLIFTTKTGTNPNPGPTPDSTPLHAQEQTHNTVMGQTAGVSLLASGAEQISQALNSLSLLDSFGGMTGTGGGTGSTTGTGTSVQTGGEGGSSGQSGSGGSEPSGQGQEGSGGSATGNEKGQGEESDDRNKNGSGQSDQQESNAEANGIIIASVGGGHMHQETGSHVTSNSWNGVLGIGGKRAAKNGTWQYLAFVEHGRANFTLHSDTGRGDGTSKYVGGGLIGKWQNRRNVYVEASIRAGRMHDTASDMLYDEATGQSYGYDVHANYIGGHVGLGKVFYYDNGRNLDVYARYFHMKRDGVSFDAGGHFDLDSVTSSVLRVGARYGATDKKWNWYGGLAYEYEFDGKSTGRADGAPIRAASIEGGSVRGEIGLRMEASKSSPWKADINLSGYAGKRRGISGNVAVAYTF